MLSHFSRVRLCNRMNHSPPGSSVCGISQTRILEWVAMLFSRGSSQTRDWTPVLTGGFFTTSTTWEAWISRHYTHIPSLLSFPPILLSHPSRSSQSTRRGSLCQTSHHLSIFHMIVYMCWCCFPHLSHSPLLYCVHSLHLSLHSFPAILISCPLPDFASMLCKCLLNKWAFRWMSKQCPNCSLHSL